MRAIRISIDAELDEYETPAVFAMKLQTNVDIDSIEITDYETGEVLFFES